MSCLLKCAARIPEQECQVNTQASQCADNGHSDQRCNQTIFNRVCAIFFDDDDVMMLCMIKSFRVSNASLPRFPVRECSFPRHPEL